jgi:hypothetical protein
MWTGIINRYISQQAAYRRFWQLSKDENPRKNEIISRGLSIYTDYLAYEFNSFREVV